MNKHFFLLYTLIGFTLCAPIASEQTTQDHTITVFVHGTFPARKLLQFTPGRSLIYCPQGLSLAKNISKKYHFHKMVKGCVDLNPTRYNFDQFYIFGWKSEEIYNDKRILAAEKLVKDLQILVNNYYQNHKVIPKLQLIGFSHGGNVVLHTANYLPLTVQNKKVEITVWLFGTPVQTFNQDLVNSLNFIKVYSVYSKKDWLQRMDPQGLRSKKLQKHKIWSDRTFNSTDRCVQVEFTVNNKSIAHSYYRRIFKYLPKIQELIEAQSQELASGLISINFDKP